MVIVKCELFMTSIFRFCDHKKLWSSSTSNFSKTLKKHLHISIPWGTWLQNLYNFHSKYCAITQTHLADALTRNVHKSDTTVSNICYANNRRSMIKSRWPLYQEFGSHMKKDNANRFADPENLYTGTRFQGDSEIKISRKRNNDGQVAAILIIGGKLKI